MRWMTRLAVGGGPCAPERCSELLRSVYRELQAAATDQDDDGSAGHTLPATSSTPI